MMGGDGGGDCGGGDFCVSGGGGESGDPADVGNPKQANPIDERPKINGAPVIEQSHELVIKKSGTSQGSAA